MRHAGTCCERLPLPSMPLLQGAPRALLQPGFLAASAVHRLPWRLPAAVGAAAARAAGGSSGGACGGAANVERAAQQPAQRRPIGMACLEDLPACKHRHHTSTRDRRLRQCCLQGTEDVKARGVAGERCLLPTQLVPLVHSGHAQLSRRLSSARLRLGRASRQPVRHSGHGPALAACCAAHKPKSHLAMCRALAARLRWGDLWRINRELILFNNPNPTATAFHREITKKSHSPASLACPPTLTRILWSPLFVLSPSVSLHESLNMLCMWARQDGI